MKFTKIEQERNGERDLEIRYYSLSKNLCSICFKDR